MLVALPVQEKLSPVFPPRRKQEPSRLHLGYLDGIRGLTALYVSVFHAVLTATWTGTYGRLPSDLPRGLTRLLPVFLFGHFAVGVFIILSGYCLMLPVAKSRDGRLPKGVASFLWRRARRIVPPYYAALAFCLALTLLPGFDHPTGSRWDEVLPAWNGGSIFSHLLLIQNWNTDWFFKINAPAWSVAPEWQIYWLFALLLLPLGRKIGVPLTAALSLTAGVALHFCTHGRYDFIGAGFAGLFAMGMLGAAVNFSDAAWARFCRENISWGIVAAAAWMVFLGIASSQGPIWTENHGWLINSIVGLGTSSLLISCTRACIGTHTDNASLILKFFRARWLVALGGFSYSYYLLHDPILGVAHHLLQPQALGYTANIGLLLILGLPFCALVAYCFHLCFERPFMPARPGLAVAHGELSLSSPHANTQ